jgi:transaldolase
MKFFVDTADVAAISELNDLGMVDGVTTNPSLILKSGRDILEVTKEICGIVSGPVSAEVVALTADEMIAEGRKLAEIAPNITVKVPLTWDGRPIRRFWRQRPGRPSSAPLSGVWMTSTLTGWT